MPIDRITFNTEIMGASPAYVANGAIVLVEPQRVRMRQRRLADYD